MIKDMKALFFTVCFAPFFMVAQGDFRNMNWGETFEDLKEKTPDVKFEIEQQGEWIVYTHKDVVAGTDAYVLYTFSEDGLIIAGYFFEYALGAGINDRIRSYNTVSSRLSEKYSMTESNDWVDDTWKDSPDDLSFALGLGDVVLMETTETARSVILHQMGKINGSFSHTVFYYSTEMMEQESKERADDF